MDFIHHFFSEEIIYALGWTVVHSLWQGIFVGILLTLVLMALENKSARLRYEVAGMALFSMLVISLATFILMLNATESPEFNPIKIIVTDGQYHSIILKSGELGWASAFFQSIAEYLSNHIALIVNIWLIGFLFFAFRLASGLFEIHQIRTTDRMVVAPYWQQKLNRLARKLPLQRSVKLASSALLKVPVMIGYFKPLILIPLGTINTLTEEEVEAILAHELAHAVRNDYLMNLFFSLIEILFYYHPVVWLMAATVRTERENCCDDLALQLCPNPVAYAKALFKLEQAHQKTTVPTLALSFSDEKHHLLNRIKRILNQPQNKSNIMEKFSATTFLLAAIVVLSIGASTPFSEENKKRHLESSIAVLENPVITIKEFIPAIMAIPLDTVPTTKRDRKRIVKSEDGKSVDMTFEDDEMIKLKIDGRDIPPTEFGQYESLANEMVSEFNNIPPPPPAPPTPFSAPGAPEAPAAPMAPVPNENQIVISIDGETGETEHFIINDEEIIINGETIHIEQEVEEEVRLAMKEHERAMEEHHKEIERLHEKMEEHHERMAEQRERMAEKREQMAEMREETRKKAIERRLEIENEIDMDIDDDNEGSVSNISVNNIGRFDDEIHEALVAELLQDGLIESISDYKLELTGKQFKVNGKKQSDPVLNKYLDLYYEITGFKLQANSKLKIKKKS